MSCPLSTTRLMGSAAAGHVSGRSKDVAIPKLLLQTRNLREK